MRADKLVKISFSKGLNQLNDVSGQFAQLSTIPLELNADALLGKDRQRIIVDCTANDVTLTLRDATQLGDWTWIIYRSDASGFTFTIVAEDVAQLINGATSLVISGGDSVIIHSEQNKYTLS